MIPMRIVLSNRWIEKIPSYNALMTSIAFRLVQSKCKSCAYSKMKTHYDTLEVSPNATQNEIKSAYYKLSMLYHPDRNKSEFANRKFQNISQAYDVLNNYQTRKRYDRSIMVKQNIQENIPKTTYVYASIYKSKIDPTEKNKRFNFDEWTRQHYGETLHRKKKEKFTKASITTSENENDKESIILYVAILSLIIYFVLKFISTVDYDVPRKTKKHDEV
ncbi:hypothetical protein HZH66_009872 [Vespula vulgaris]|uniref:J domain-containing protein n=1 Tax=Vespula vulgaris TaxID=7454 RepID=A0A834JQC1_VESVU|nr:hypothetical protein HZH66_009872 [Vespula vulgaris]